MVFCYYEDVCIMCIFCGVLIRNFILDIHKISKSELKSIMEAMFQQPNQEDCLS